MCNWHSTSYQRLLALVDTGSNCSLICGNPDRFPGPTAFIDSYGGKTIKTTAVTLPFGIGCLLLCSYKVYVSMVPEYILKVDILQGLNPQTSACEFCPWIWEVKTTVWGYTHHLPQRCQIQGALSTLSQVGIYRGATTYWPCLVWYRHRPKQPMSWTSACVNGYSPWRWSIAYLYWQLGSVQRP